MGAINRSVLQRVLSQVTPPSSSAASSIVVKSFDQQLPFPTALPPSFPSEGNQDSDETLALLLPLLILLTTLLFLLLLFLIFLIVIRRNRGIVLRDDGGPTNLEREDEIEGEGGVAGVEQRWLDGVEPAIKTGYMRAKVWQSQYPPNSQPTDITLSQFLSIQEKGVSAWSFEPDYESNPALIVEARTEITFLADGVGMAVEEGGGCCVQSNLPLPRLNEVYYWECKMYEKPAGTTVAIGLATKPFPSFRLPGWNKYSVGYFSSDGFKSHSYPFTASSYGPPLTEGDVLGVGYRPRTGTVFFTRNGKKLDDAFIGLHRHNLFPTVGADASCSVHVNLGQAGFVFIEANVKKWGLAPMVGSLLPPPAYGSERGSILLESARNGRRAAAEDERDDGDQASTRRNLLVPPPPMLDPAATVASSSRRSAPAASSSSSTGLLTPSASRHRTKRAKPVLAPTPTSSSSSSLTSNVRSTSSTATAAAAAHALASPSRPLRPSPLRHSRRASSTPDRLSPTHSAHSSTSSTSAPRDIEGIDSRNPPTPGTADISLRSLHAFPDRDDLDDVDEEGEVSRYSDERESGSGEEYVDGEEEEGRGADEGRILLLDRRNGAGSGSGNANGTRRATVVIVEPPAYHPIDPHMYAPGVAEAVLEDAFSTPALRQFAPQLPSGMSFSPSSSTSPQQTTLLPTSQNLRGGSDVSGSASGGGGGGGWFDWLGARGIPQTDATANVAASNSNNATVVDIYGARRPAGGTR